MIDCGRVCCQHYRSDQEDWVGVARPTSWAYGTAMFILLLILVITSRENFVLTFSYSIEHLSNVLLHREEGVLKSLCMGNVLLSPLEPSSRHLFGWLWTSQVRRCQTNKMADFVAKRKTELNGSSKVVTVDMRQLIYYQSFDKKYLQQQKLYLWVK